MAIATVTSIVKQIKKLSATEKDGLRTALAPVLPLVRPHVTEDDFRQALKVAGMLSSPAPEGRAKAARRLPFKPVPVRGMPVSETIMKERR